MPTTNEQAATWQNQASANESIGLNRNLKNAGAIGPRAYRAAGGQLQTQGYANLMSMLQNQGRMDPRILARQQALNAMATQRQATTAAGNAARSGFGGGGYSSALQAAIQNAGMTRDQNLRYQDISDSYGRNQQNLGLLNDMVIQPGLQYAGVGNSQYNADRQNKNQGYGAAAGVVSSLLGAFI